MSDYIERDAVLRHYKDVDKSLVDSLSHAILKALTVYVEDLPAADVAPVKHGTWEKTPTYGVLMCSACRDCYIDENFLDGKKWNFCPECGAKMDGGDDDATDHV